LDENDNDEADVQQISEPSTVWQYAVRSDKSYDICLLCNKRITTNNWSTSSIRRRHLIQVHKKTEF